MCLVFHPKLSSGIFAEQTAKSLQSVKFTIFCSSFMWRKGWGSSTRFKEVANGQGVSGKGRGWRWRKSIPWRAEVLACIGAVPGKSGQAVRSPCRSWTPGVGTPSLIQRSWVSGLKWKQKVHRPYASQAVGLLQISECKRAKSLESCPTLCDPMDCSLPGFSVPGILQARILEWVALPSSRGSSQARDRTCISFVTCIGSWVLYHWCHLGSPQISIQLNKY